VVRWVVLLHHEFSPCHHVLPQDQKQQSQSSMEWSLQNCEPKYLFLFKIWSSQAFFIIVMESWLIWEKIHTHIYMHIHMHMHTHIYMCIHTHVFLFFFSLKTPWWTFWIDRYSVFSGHVNSHILSILSPCVMPPDIIFVFKGKLYPRYFYVLASDKEKDCHVSCLLI
jgi:hypothetical protein